MLDLNGIEHLQMQLSDTTAFKELTLSCELRFLTRSAE